MDADPITRTASDADAAFVFHEWDRRTRAHDIDALLELYTPGAVLESPLIPRILDRRSGVLVGREQIRPFFQRGTDNRPNDLVRWYRTGRYHFDGHTLMWEYPRSHPDGGDQVDLAEVMDLRGPRSRATASTGVGSVRRSWSLNPETDEPADPGTSV